MTQGADGDTKGDNLDMDDLYDEMEDFDCEESDSCDSLNSNSCFDWVYDKSLSPMSGLSPTNRSLRSNFSIYNYEFQ